MQLFDYQEEFITLLGKAFRKNKRVIGCSPTGSGKTVIMSDVTRRSIEKGNIVCISCHREEIFNQTFKALLKFGVTPGVIAAGSQATHGHKCYLSMVETFCRRVKKGVTDHLGINFYILDEVHYGSYHKMIQQIDDPILGLTASPKTTGKPELKEYFEDIVLGPPVSKLIELGRLIKGVTFSTKHDFSNVKKKGGDFDDKELMKEFSKPKLREGAVKFYLEVAKGRKALCYNVNVEQSLDVMRQFRDHGIKAAHVDGNTSKTDRAAIFRMYEHEDIDVVCNVGVATTGTDIPVTGCIIQNFATMSLVKHVQTVGRGARTYPGKEDFIIIDMGMNWVRHGLFGEDIDWKDIYENPIKAITKEEKKKAQRECDECGMVIKFTLRSCPYCGDITSAKDLEERMLKSCTLEEIRDYKFKKLPHNLRRSPMDLGYNELKQYAQTMGYNPKWVHKMMNLKKK